MQNSRPSIWWRVRPKIIKIFSISRDWLIFIVIEIVTGCKDFYRSKIISIFSRSWPRSVCKIWSKKHFLAIPIRSTFNSQPFFIRIPFSVSSVTPSVCKWQAFDSSNFLENEFYFIKLNIIRLTDKISYKSDIVCSCRFYFCRKEFSRRSPCLWFAPELARIF